MGHAPDTVNYKGEVLTEEMKKYLYGEMDETEGWQRHGGKVSKERAQEILTNWMFGIKPTPIDPSEAIGRASKLAPQEERAAAGMGMGGLFGFGKSVGNVP